jgi:uncharacterized phage protein gp47/JayE
MPFARPTLDELLSRTKAEIASRMGLTTLIRRGPLDVLAKVLAGASHLEHGHLDAIAKQLFPNTASGTDLDGLASLYDIARKAPTYATGVVTFTGTNGATVPNGTQLRRSDAAEFTTLADAVLGASGATVPIVSALAGLAANTDAGAGLALISPILGVQSPAIVTAAGVEGGFDQETDDELRVRLLARMSSPPAGGNAGDYKAWALSVAGVTRVWVYPLTPEIGFVTVIFTTDDAPGGSIPTQDDVDAVKAYIDSVRPLGATVIVLAPLVLALDITLHISPDTADLRTEVTAALSDLILQEAQPGGTLYLSHMEEAISTTPSIVDVAIAVPAANVVAPAKTLLQLGTITWT